MKFIVNLFDWHTDWKLSSDYVTTSKRSRRVLELLRWCEATHYYSSSGALEYMNEEGVFPVEDIEVLFQNFHIKHYPQMGSTQDFFPSLSILDALFNVGPEETAKLITNDNNYWDTRF